ncbi:MAG: DEAD/DEAH box helicase [Lentisphaeraceae bacterium]|nr:DEAD/DEAH box helicase [Lentisphaeraceae bacterium]
MIKKLFRKLFGRQKPEIEVVPAVVPEEKPRPSTPESSKKKKPEFQRSENQSEGKNKHQKTHKKRQDRGHGENRRKADLPSKSVSVKASQPEEGWEPESIPEVSEGTSFYSVGLSNPVLHGIHDLGFAKCTDIQATTLPEALKGRDIAGKAQTGTGKTAAFLISIFDYFIKNPLSEPYSGTPRCLILAPTRELAVQIGKDAVELGKYCDAKTVTVYGGMDFEKQAQEFYERVDILVATPGRLLDYTRRKIVQLNKVELLVLDEADRMLDMGFIPDVRRIIGQIPHSDRRITQLYSATLSEAVMNLAQRWMKKDYHIVEIDPETVVSTNVEQTVYMVSAKQKVPIILWYLKNEPVERMIIFTNRKDESLALSDKLFEYGIDLELLTGDVAQKKRMRILEKFREGEVKVIVATDVAGRGIHVDNVSHVFNYELPYEAEDYVHRVGRTGRAGSQGKAISFACENSAFELPSIEEYIGHSLTCSSPETEYLEEHEKVREAPVRKKQHNNNRSRNGNGNNRHRNNRGNGRNHRRS